MSAIAAAVCAATLSLQAQTQPQTPAAPAAGRAAAANPARIIVIGCISRDQARSSARGAAPLVLTDARNDPPAVYRLEGDQAALALKVGHTVEITGALSPQTPAARGSTPPRTLKVETLTWISTTCVKNK